MARQYLQDGGLVEAAIADPLAADVATTAVLMWEPGRYTVIPAYEARPGKVYFIEAWGLITTAATGALTINMGLGTSATAFGTTLGASIAQTVPVSSLSGPWYMRSMWTCIDTGSIAGSNAHIIGSGVFISGGVAATANSGLNVNFGGTSVAFNHSAIAYFSCQKTLSVAGSFTTKGVIQYSPN